MISIPLQALFIFVVGLVLFTMGLCHQEVIGFESRFYLFALEMWRHGPTIFPTTYGMPYPDYPATGTFLIYLCSKVMGGLSKFSAVFPSAVASAITLSTTYLIGALHSRRWGVSAALFLLFTATFLVAARSLSLDPYVAMITTLSFYVIYSAHYLQKSSRIIWIFPLLILGFAFRGPLGLVIPTSVICVFYLLEKNIKQFFIIGSLAALLLILCSASLLGLAYYEGGSLFLQDVVKMQVLGRMQHDEETLPFFFYFKESLGAYAVSFPLAILVLMGVLFKRGTSKEKDLLFKLMGWALVILIGLSIPSDKKIRYILPIAPALALICGYLFTISRDSRYLYILRRVFYWFCLLFPLVCSIAISVAHHHRQADWNFSYPTALGVLLGLQVLMLFVWRREILILALAAFAFFASYVLVAEKINLDVNRTRDFVEQVEKLRYSQQAELVFYNENMDGLAIKYLVYMSAIEEPDFVKDFSELKKSNKPVFLITREKYFDQIPQNKVRVILRGKVGHKSVVVFSVK